MMYFSSGSERRVSKGTITAARRGIAVCNSSIV
jgi:hypothetical protein